MHQALEKLLSELKLYHYPANTKKKDKAYCNEGTEYSYGKPIRNDYSKHQTYCKWNKNNRYSIAIYLRYNISQ